MNLEEYWAKFGKSTDPAPSSLPPLVARAINSMPGTERRNLVLGLDYDRSKFYVIEHTSKSRCVTLKINAPALIENHKKGQRLFTGLIKELIRHSVSIATNKNYGFFDAQGYVYIELDNRRALGRYAIVLALVPGLILIWPFLRAIDFIAEKLSTESTL